MSDYDARHAGHDRRPQAVPEVSLKTCVGERVFAAREKEGFLWRCIEERAFAEEL
jgi:hypothetical protein